MCIRDRYLIGRKEAKDDLGIKTIQFADKKLADLMTELYEEYKREMGLGILWNPENELGENQAINKKEYKIAYIESEFAANYFELILEYKKSQVPMTQQTPQGPIQISQERVMWRVVGQGWKGIKN